MPSEISGKNWFYNSLDLHRVIANWYSRPNTLIPFEYIHILQETCMWEGGYGSQTLTELNFLTYTLFIMSHYIHTINILSAYILISETHIKYHTSPVKTLELSMWYERQKQINLNTKHNNNKKRNPCKFTKFLLNTETIPRLPKIFCKNKLSQKCSSVTE